MARPFDFIHTVFHQEHGDSQCLVHVCISVFLGIKSWNLYFMFDQTAHWIKSSTFDVLGNPKSDEDVVEFLVRNSANWELTYS